MTDHRFQPLRLRPFLFALALGAGLPATAQLPQLPIGPQPCPPNTSCVPGTPPAIPPVPPSCGPGPGGNPCGQAGPASTGSSNGINIGAGNPINLINGNKYQREVDMAPLPGVLGLEVVRHYNSALSGPNASTNLMGRGWKLSYETDLYVVGKTVQIVQADGARLIFSRDPANPSLCASGNPSDGTVIMRRGRSGEEFLWRMGDGRQLSFNSAGKLVQILAPTGEFVSMRHDSKGLLVSVTDPQGRELRLHYLDRASARAGDAFRGVQSIDSPLGRYTYGYGSKPPAGAAVSEGALLASLVRVGYPQAGMGRSYHYEDPRHPTLLTGISVAAQAGSLRLSTYGYQADGKAVLSTQAGNTNKVTLAFGPGRTLLTNSLGQKTEYRHAILGGEYRLLEVRGPGCATCGETNVRYQYDEFARLTTTIKLDDAGRPLRALRTEFDALGRPARISQLSYTGGKPGAGGASMRYLYGEAGLPAQVVRSSVVPGKEVLTSISYNGAGQPLEVSERGWAPGSGGEAVPIARSTRYGYRQINGRSLLVSIDGPLPNGPSASPLDSDITRLEWDKQGNAIVAVTGAGNVRSTLAYDNLWRITTVTNDSGASTSFRYDARNRRTEVSADGVVYHTRFDALDRVAETGYTRNGSYTALSKRGGDLTYRNSWSVSREGVLVRQSSDTEGRVLETSMQAGHARQVRLFGYDEANRLASVSDGPETTRRIVWNTLGQVAARVDALGREQRYRYDADGQMVEVTDAAGTPFRGTMRIGRDALGLTNRIEAPNGALTRYVNDDFGRTLVIASPDSGTVARSYDLADRVVGSTDSHGNRASYAYDAAGRIVRQDIVGAGSVTPVSTTWRWRGKDLLAIEHPVQSERYTYDVQHRLLSKTVILHRAGAAPIVSRTSYDYHDDGQPRSITLADGSVIEYKRNAQHALVGLERHRVRTSWLRWLLPSQTLASNIERDQVDISAFDYGNGVQARFQRSPEGTLARIVYRLPQERASGKVLAAAGAKLLPGIAPANAATASAVQTSPAQALALPREPNSLLDHRYLWDVQGNLLSVRGNDEARDFAYDALDRLLVEARTGAGPGTRQVAFDAASTAARYFYDASGNRVLGQQGAGLAGGALGPTVRTTYVAGANRQLTDSDLAAPIRYDASGLPLAAGRRALEWDALGKLTAVHQDGKPLAAYRYNHRGERVAKTAGAATRHFLYTGRKVGAEIDAGGQVMRQYLYLGGKPFAIIDHAGGVRPDSEERSASGQAWHDIGLVFKAWFGNARETLAYLHTNHLGAPEAATDAQARPVWQARYSGFGVVAVSHDGKGFVQPLRLPGQYEDGETGLYYNDHRYYDPQAGRYLSPDPLGLQADINSYAYVSNNPLRYVDPEGLVLFSFDGTGNTNNEQELGQDGSLSNVWRFTERYQDGRTRYISGVGTVDVSDPDRPIRPRDYVPVFGLFTPVSIDMGFNYSGAARIARMEEYFNSEADLLENDEEAMNIDIVGFSRGAAQARDFANRIAARTTPDGWYQYTVPGQNGAPNVTRCQKVNFRFLGLWDTVLSTNSGPAYNLGIPEQFHHVAQAVALNEFRGQTGRWVSGSWLGAFPLESIKGARTPQGTVRIERGFLGSHSDIGGGYGANESQLAQVALEWMVSQAVAAGVKIDDAPRTVIANPIVHDKSNNQNQLNGRPTGEDRDVHYRDGTVVKQRQMVLPGMQFTDTEQFISYRPSVLDANGNLVRSTVPGAGTGTVDMAGYLAWLKANGYELNLTVQAP
jgi:RHS repeat-associated protein